MRHFDMPHPLVTLSGLAVLGGLVALRIANFRLPVFYDVCTVVFLLVFVQISRRSARKMRERRIQKLEALRGKPVLHLND
jgi:hypothetical protein